ncbi:MAG TPA: hypothetical protein VFM41_04960 [Gaiella sp.]|nr:hypothetical protein [Gaiella sp.]
MTTSMLIGTKRELAHRVGAGIEVTLLWDPDGDSTSIELWHAATGETLQFEVQSELALDAFYHPLVHLWPERRSAPSR